MRQFACAAVVVAAVAALSLSTAPSPGAVHADPAPKDLVWLALGDSYSSGEGLRFVDTDANPAGTNCERATGQSTVNNGNGSRAYGAFAYDALRGEWQNSTFRLLACTGATSNQVHDQFREWAATDGRLADLITMSMGGNNLGFTDVIFGCIGVSWEGGFAAAASAPLTVGGAAAWSLNPFIGCTESEQSLRDKIATLVGDTRVGPDDGQTLPDMYRELVANSMNPGGHIVVVGYPNIVEESGRWVLWWLEGNRCSRIRRADAALLRSVTGEFNLQLSKMVARLNAENLGVTFHWLDASQEYENDGSRHGLCTGDPWINALTFGMNGPHAGVAPVRLERSFHPTQDGHDTVGTALAGLVADLDWGNLQRPPVSQECPLAIEDSGLGLEDGTFISEITATGASCDDVFALIFHTVSVHEWGGPTTVSVEGYSCTWENRPFPEGDASGRAFYTCIAGATVISWVYVRAE
jgi:hypothetical protein